jgi:hypothetical protein
MGTSPEYTSSQPLTEEIDVARDEHDFLPHLQPLDEAISVAFLAVRTAQQAAREVPVSAPAAKFRDEWHASNILVRLAFRLVDERVQDLNGDMKRQPRLG